jgi:hypothetical protein
LAALDGGGELAVSPDGQRRDSVLLRQLVVGSDALGYGVFFLKPSFRVLIPDEVGVILPLRPVVVPPHDKRELVRRQVPPVALQASQAEPRSLLARADELRP